MLWELIVFFYLCDSEFKFKFTYWEVCLHCWKMNTFLTSHQNPNSTVPRSIELTFQYRQVYKGKFPNLLEQEVHYTVIIYTILTDVSLFRRFIQCNGKLFWFITVMCV